MDICEQLCRYYPYNEQEENDLIIIRKAIDENPLIFTRKSLEAHITVSAWVVNLTHDKVLFAFHNIYNSWAWLGGHADGETDLLHVALKEAEEESGIKTLNPVSESPFSLEILPVSGHIKNGSYVSTHLHLNFTYLIEADETEPLYIKADENSNVDWLTFDEIMEKSTEDWIKERIYKKLIEKTEVFYASRNSL